MPTLDWIGKKAVVNHHKEVPYRLIRCEGELSAGAVGEGNLLVEGDNLEALKALLPYYAGKVKCIYIDPPYNTGNEKWAYNDNVNSPEIRKWLGQTVGREAEDLSRHDKWLCMMYPRLILLRDFLREDGAIFISIDDNEVGHLRCIMDEIFGRKNLIASFVWQKRASPDNDETFATSVHDNIVTYAKDMEKARFHRLPRTEEANARYENPDNDPRGSWTSSDLTRREYREHDFYPIRLPSGRDVSPAAGRSWSIPKENFEVLRMDNRIWFGPDGNAMPRRKRFLSEVSTGIVPTTWWTKEIFGDNQSAKRELRNIFHDVDDIFATPKPLLLIQRICEIAADKDSLILDSFAGSGTTAHAVLQLNKLDGGSRRVILIEAQAEIARNTTAKRLHRAIAGYGQKPALGGGFRYCVLGEPLFDERGKIREAVKYRDLAHHVYFTETGEPLPKSNGKQFPLLGVLNGRAIYLLFNGVLGDKSAKGGNVLNLATLQKLPDQPGPRVVYGTACRISAARMKREGIAFKQIPYEIKVS